MANESTPQKTPSTGQNRILILLMAFAIMTSAFKDLDRLQSVTRRIHSVASSCTQLGSTLYASEIEPAPSCPEALPPVEKREECDQLAAIDGGVAAEPVEIVAVAVKKNREQKDYARMKTLNPEVMARMARADWRYVFKFKQGKGRVDLDFPQVISTAVDAETFGADNLPDFHLRGLGRLNRKRVQLTTDDAGRELLLRTLNGNSRIRRVG